MTSCPSFLPRSLLLATAAAIICLPGGAPAQDTKAPRGDRRVGLGFGIPDALDFHGHAGIAVGIAPEFEGGDDMAAMALPLLDIRQQDFLFVRGASTNPNDGYGSIGWYALNFGYDAHARRIFGLSLGPLARFNRGRDDGDSDALNGLGDIDDSVGLGGFLALRAGGWSADMAAVAQDAGEPGDGLLVSLRGGYTVQPNSRFSITPGVFASWGDDDYMQGFFGVSTAQAAGSGLARSDADSGLKDVGVSLRVNYTLSGNILVSAEAGYQRLLGDAADSPIVDGPGSRDQVRALIGIAYKF